MGAGVLEVEVEVEVEDVYTVWSDADGRARRGEKGSDDAVRYTTRV